jgi:hypothetical protein
MKRLINYGSMLLLILFVMSSCKKNSRSLDLNVTTVSTLKSPADAADIVLAPASGESVTFQWDATSAADGDLVLYEIVFDKENGDFSKPIYKTVSSGGGVQPRINLTHKDLNKIANTAGIAASSSGKLKWAVIVSKAYNTKLSSVSRTIKVDRPAGFAEIPEAMYLTGTATEGGDDITKAVALKKTEAGVFEIYTSLKAGNYVLSDKAAAGGKKYYVDNGLIKEGETPVTVAGGTKVYRIVYDFNVATVTQTEIQSIGLYMSAYNTEIGMLNYKSNGTWEAASIPVEFYQFSWGRDERYKFKVHTAAGDEWYGSTNQDNQSPVGQQPSYFYLIRKDNNQWNNTYKFNPAADMHNVKVDVFFKADAVYTHQVTVIN